MSVREQAARLEARLIAYRHDGPLDGRHSDLAGANAYELIDEAADLCAAIAKAFADRPLESVCCIEEVSEMSEPCGPFVSEQRRADAAEAELTRLRAMLAAIEAAIREGAAEK